jgi:hypothetical protein
LINSILARRRTDERRHSDFRFRVFSLFPWFDSFDLFIFPDDQRRAGLFGAFDDFMSGLSKGGVRKLC